MQNTPPIVLEDVLSRSDYQEILLAKMAGGDLYANEQRMLIRRADIMLDRFREKPLYPQTSVRKR